MVLSDLEIKMEIGSGRLRFTPEIEWDQITPSSVDLRLGNEFTTFRRDAEGAETIVDLGRVGNVEEIAERYGDRSILAQGETLRLNPGQLTLAYTLEYIEMPNYLAARVEGRSSLGRLGISIHQTAPTVHATFQGQLRLEILNSGPGSLACFTRGQRICQLVFERLNTPYRILTLASRFQGQRQGRT